MRIFLVSYGGGHVTAILPVIRELTARGHDCRYLALTTAGEIARRSEIPHSRVIDHVNLDEPGLRGWGERLAEHHHTDGKGITHAESIAYLGVSFRDLAADLGEDEAWSRYERFGLNAFTPVYFMHEILDRLDCDLVVATTSPRMEKAALRAAYQKGIPSLCMVELFGLLEEPWLSRPDNGDVLAVSRRDVIDRLVAAGRQRSDVFLTGSPMFDLLADPELPDAGRRWRRDRGVCDQERLVFWAEQPEPPSPELPRQIRVHLAEICRRRGWRLAVRLHPSSTDPLRETMPEGVLQSHADEPLSHLINACDVAVTLTSTVGWEVLLTQKPLLVLRISAYSEFVSFGCNDGALAMDRLEDAEAGLESLLSDSAAARDLASLRNTLPRPGGATQRVCDLIETEVPRRDRLRIQTNG